MFVFVFGAEITFLEETFAQADKSIQRLTGILSVFTKLQSADPEVVRELHLFQEALQYMRRLMPLFVC